MTSTEMMMLTMLLKMLMATMRLVQVYSTAHLLPRPIVIATI